MYHTHNLRHKNTQNISDKHHNSQIIIQYSDNLLNFHSIPLHRICNIISFYLFLPYNIYLDLAFEFIRLSYSLLPNTLFLFVPLILCDGIVALLKGIAVA